MIAMRAVLAYSGIGAANAVRTGFCALAFIAVGAFTGSLIKIPTLSFQLYVVLLISAGGSMFLGDGAYFLATRRIGIVRAFPISMSYPLITALGAVFLFAEETSWPLWIGALLIVLGTCLLGIPRSQTAAGFPSGWKNQVVGLTLAIIAAAGWAIGVLGLKSALLETDLVTTSIVRMVFACLGCVLLAAILPGFSGDWPRGMARKLVLIAGLATVATTFFLLWAIDVVGAARASLLNGAAPLFAAPAARIFFKESLTSRSILGIVLTVVGVMLVVQRGL